ncbi:ribosomal protein L15 [Cutaneotrichosporon oleaginosum]|uniref:Ribosomal protein L15 n=1 Tax=Cutaneotrichosporon oleaginosum TaxID=879819 RepID=A0A0J1B3R6_9TREE|nr:ribosomal protein L15 [Cutaneotrichosporon oleaginosum]KLT42299.1 ribosomal protein L15 [Cutaneotrichosporon oleaginosum]TXT11471.1 hypothetical protein COLE_01881 [Cutaneotrichosporon oleaginosum]
MLGLTSLRAALAVAIEPTMGIRAMSTTHLGNLAPAKGSTKVNLRRGRGEGSTKGGQAGRGHKGQNARSGTGKPTPGFAGGQTPLHRLFPKRGFVNFTRRVYAPLQVATLQRWIALGRINPTAPITIGTVVRANAVHGLSKQAGVKLVGKPDTSLPLPPVKLELSRFSKGAADAIIAAGGEVEAVYHNNLSLRQEIWPEKMPRPVKSALPIRRTDIEFYSNPENHGYLAKRGIVIGKQE